MHDASSEIPVARVQARFNAPETAMAVSKDYVPPSVIARHQLWDGPRESPRVADNHIQDRRKSNCTLQVSHI